LMDNSSYIVQFASFQFFLLCYDAITMPPWFI
jgi:hypothetical protein